MTSNQQQLELEAEREAHETIYSIRVSLEQVQDLAAGYTPRVVVAMAQMLLDTEDRYERAAARPVKGKR